MMDERHRLSPPSEQGVDDEHQLGPFLRTFIRNQSNYLRQATHQALDNIIDDFTQTLVEKVTTQLKDGQFIRGLYAAAALLPSSNSNAGSSHLYHPFQQSSHLYQNWQSLHPPPSSPVPQLSLVDSPFAKQLEQLQLQMLAHIQQQLQQQQQSTYQFLQQSQETGDWWNTPTAIAGPATKIDSVDSDIRSSSSSSEHTGLSSQHSSSESAHFINPLPDSYTYQTGHHNSNDLGNFSTEIDNSTNHFGSSYTDFSTDSILKNCNANTNAPKNTNDSVAYSNSSGPHSIINTTQISLTDQHNTTPNISCDNIRFIANSQPVTSTANSNVNSSTLNMNSIERIPKNSGINTNTNIGADNNNSNNNKFSKIFLTKNSNNNSSLINNSSPTSSNSTISSSTNSKYQNLKGIFNKCRNKSSNNLSKSFHTKNTGGNSINSKNESDPGDDREYISLSGSLSNSSFQLSNYNNSPADNTNKDSPEQPLGNKRRRPSDDDDEDSTRSASKRTEHKGALIKCDVPDCSKYFDSVSTMNSHLERRHNIYPHFCMVCSTSFPNILDLRGHIDSAHGEMNKFLCTHCHTAYPSYRSLSLHAKKMHFKRQYKCPISGCTFTSELNSKVVEHLQTTDHKQLEEFAD